MSELTKLQAEVAEWAFRNFPNATVRQPLIGVAEECGELCHAHLKAEQGIRGTPEEHLAAKKDAIGDMMIFLMHYCVLAGIDWIEVEAESASKQLSQDQSRSPLWIVSAIGGLGSVECSGLPRRERIFCVARIQMAIEKYAYAHGIEFLDTVREVWKSVRQRDWQANKQDGGAE